MATYAPSETVDAVSAIRNPARMPWKTLAWFGALLLICYVPLLYDLARQWAADENMGHGFFVPIVAGYVAWQRRSQLMAEAAVSNYWGLVLVAGGALQLMLGTLAAQIFIARTAFLVSLSGTLLFLGGTRLLKILGFPLTLLLFMFPLPAILYARITLPLQILASAVAESCLNGMGVPVWRDGNILELAHQRLSVVEACSGIRSLLSLSFLALLYAHFFDTRAWMRWALAVATVPIAIAANSARVTMMGLLSEYRPALAQGVFHLMEGWVLFVVALVLMAGLHTLLCRCIRFKHDVKA